MSGSGRLAAMSDESWFKLLARRRSSRQNFDKSDLSLKSTGQKEESDDSGISSPIECNPSSMRNESSKTNLFHHWATLEDNEQYECDYDEDYDDYDPTRDPSSAYYSLSPSASQQCRDFKIFQIANELEEWLDFLLDSDFRQVLEELFDQDVFSTDINENRDSIEELATTNDLVISRDKTKRDDLIKFRISSSSKSLEWRRIQGKAYLTILELNKKHDLKRIVYYLYPGLMHVISGQFDQDLKLIKGLPGKLERIIFHLGIPFPAVKTEKNPLLREDLASAVQMGSFPLLRDCMEQSSVYVAKSELPAAGEGLFALSKIHQDHLAALFNGIRVRDVDHRMNSFTDYKLMLNKEICLDIPPRMTDANLYSATLGHKACHSFVPNCVFVQLRHPRFGLIMALKALKDIKRHEEITVNYNYELYSAPEWYVRDYFDHLRNNECRSERYIFELVRRLARMNSRSMLVITAPEINSDRFCACANCGQHVSLQQDRVPCHRCQVLVHLHCCANIDSTQISEEDEEKSDKSGGIDDKGRQWKCRNCQ